jgi:hypothetical protein
MWGVPLFAIEVVDLAENAKAPHTAPLLSLFFFAQFDKTRKLCIMIAK